MSWISCCDECGALASDEGSPSLDSWWRVLAIATKLGNHKPGRTMHFCSSTHAAIRLHRLADSIQDQEEIFNGD